MKKIFVLTMVVALALAVMPKEAKATPLTSVTYALNSTDVAAFGAPNYGTVSLDLVGNTIKFTIDLADGFNVIDTGGHGAFAFNGTVAAVSMSNFSDTDFSPGSGGADVPFGTFEHTVTSSCTNGGGCGPNSFTFFVSTGGAGFTDVNQLVELSTIPPGSHQAYFAVDIANANGATGVVGAVGPALCDDCTPTLFSVPEPTSLLLLGTGLTSLGMLYRRKK